MGPPSLATPSRTDGPGAPAGRRIVLKKVAEALFGDAGAVVFDGDLFAVEVGGDRKSHVSSGRCIPSRRPRTQLAPKRSGALPSRSDQRAVPVTG
jgi:hypothetical protein